MKKHLFYLLALMMTLTASCSKEPEGLDTAATPAVEGKYRLTSLSATLDDEQTRTSGPDATTGVVNWSAKDRILIIRTSDYAQWQYELVKGANSPIGEFEPILGGDEATSTASSDDPMFSDLIAVYPAFAATATDGKITFSINKDWHKVEGGLDHIKEHSQYTGWTNDSSHGFAQNDIKVSYKCTPKANSTNNSNLASANFKFRQLGTWCKFEFDFTADESIARESLQSIRVTTVDGNVHFTGEAQVQLPDDTNPNPTLTSAGNGTEIYWEFNNPSSMSTPFTRSMMMYPGELDGQRLKIVAETNRRTFTFYATPKQSLQAGTVYHFPISLGFQSYGENNTAAAEATDLAYTMVEKGGLKPFFYYGEHNSYIVKPNVAETIYCTPYKTNAYYEKTGTLATLDAQNKPTQAKVIWYESAMGEPQLGTFDETNYTFTVTTPDGKYGNALVGVYNATDKLLWSYHIWVPQDDPTNTLTYANTKSGSYEVMPMALGATKIAVKGETQTADKRLDGLGLYYQWGRKDPLGRPAAWNNNYAVAVTAIEDVTNHIQGKAETAGAGTFFRSASYNESTADADNLLYLIPTLKSKGYIDENNTLVKQEIEEEYKGNPVKISADRYMIEQAIANPTKYVVTKSGVCSNLWFGIGNGNLWGNPQGYNFPRQTAWEKSIFDPCPKGYRVAPADLWDNSTTTGAFANVLWEFNVANGYPSSTCLADKGWEIYYEGIGTTDNEAQTYTPPVNGKTDFYPFSGYRDYESGKFYNVGSFYSYWCSTPTSAAGSRFYRFRWDKSSGGISSDSAQGYSIRCVAEP